MIKNGQKDSKIIKRKALVIYIFRASQIYVNSEDMVYTLALNH